MQGSCFSFTVCVGVTEEVAYQQCTSVGENAALLRVPDAPDAPISGLVEIVGEAWEHPSLRGGAEGAGGVGSLGGTPSPYQIMRDGSRRVSFAGSEGEIPSSQQEQHLNLHGASGSAMGTASTDDPRLYRVGSGGVVLKKITEARPMTGRSVVVRTPSTGGSSTSRLSTESSKSVESAKSEDAASAGSSASILSKEAGDRVAPLVRTMSGGTRRKSITRKSFTEEVPRALPTPLRGWRVLLAEDNQVNQMVVTRMLKNMGLHFDVVDNGKKAVEACAANDYDVVLMVRALPLRLLTRDLRLVVVTCGLWPVAWRLVGRRVACLCYQRLLNGALVDVTVTSVHIWAARHVLYTPS